MGGLGAGYGSPASCFLRLWWTGHSLLPSAVPPLMLWESCTYKLAWLLRVLESGQTSGLRGAGGGGVDSQPL